MEEVKEDELRVKAEETGLEKGEVLPRTIKEVGEGEKTESETGGGQLGGNEVSEAEVETQGRNEGNSEDDLTKVW